MDYEILMKEGMDGPSLDIMLDQMRDEGLIESYYRFQTGHYAVIAPDTTFYSALESNEGIDKILEAPRYTTLDEVSSTPPQ